MATTAELVSIAEARRGQTSIRRDASSPTPRAVAPTSQTLDNRPELSREESKAQADFDRVSAHWDKNITGQESNLSSLRSKLALIVAGVSTAQKEGFPSIAKLRQSVEGTRRSISNLKEQKAVRISKVQRRLDAVRKARAEGITFSSALAREKQQDKSTFVSTLEKRKAEGREGDVKLKERLQARGEFATRVIPKFTGETIGKTSGVYISPLTGKPVLVREGGATSLPPSVRAKFSFGKQAQTPFTRDYVLNATVRGESFNSVLGSAPVASPLRTSLNEPNASFPQVPLKTGGSAQITTQKEADFYTRVTKTQEREEEFFALFDPTKSKGAERVRKTARFFTFGDTTEPATEPRPTAVGRVSENVLVGFMTWPGVVGGAIPLTLEKLRSVPDALINLEKPTIIEESTRSLKEVEAGPFSFLPGGTPITEEGAETIISAVLFALPEAGANVIKTQSVKSVKTTDPVINKPSLPDQSKPPTQSFFRVEGTPDQVIQTRLGKDTGAGSTGIKIVPADKPGVVLRVPERPRAPSTPEIVLVKETTPSGKTFVLLEDKPFFEFKTDKPTSRIENAIEYVSITEKPAKPASKPFFEFRTEKTPSKIEGAVEYVSITEKPAKPASKPFFEFRTDKPTSRIENAIEYVSITEKPAKPASKPFFEFRTEARPGAQDLAVEIFEGKRPQPTDAGIAVITQAKPAKPASKPFFEFRKTEPQEVAKTAFESGATKEPKVIRFKWPVEVVITSDSKFLGNLFNKKSTLRGFDARQEVKPTIDNKPIVQETSSGAQVLVLEQKPAQPTTVQTPPPKSFYTFGFNAPVQEVTPTFKPIEEQRAEALKRTQDESFALIDLTTKEGTKKEAIVRLPGVRDNIIPKVDVLSRVSPKEGVRDKVDVQPFARVSPNVQPREVVSVKEQVRPRIRQNLNERLRMDLVREQKLKEPIIPLLPPPTLDKNKKRQDQGFELSVRRRGAFRTIAKGLSFEKAVKRGATIVGTTASASFKVTGAKATGPRGLNILGRQFRKSKREADVIVEKRRYRISTPGEVAEISLKGRSSKKARKKTKKLFGGAFKWV